MARILWCTDGEKAVRSNRQPTREEVELFIGTKFIKSGRESEKTKGHEGLVDIMDNWDKGSQLKGFFDPNLPISVLFRGWTSHRTNHPDVISCTRGRIPSLGRKVVLTQRFDIGVPKR